MELPNEKQLFYSSDGKMWQSSLNGKEWPNEKCKDYLYKHLKWDCYQEIVNPLPTDEQLATVAQCEMVHELSWCDLQIKLHASSDRRAVAAIDNIHAYARGCRDYVQHIDGVLTIVGDKPTKPV